MICNVGSENRPRIYLHSRRIISITATILYVHPNPFRNRFAHRRFIYIKASPLKDPNASTDNMQEPVKVKKKKNGGGRMAKDAGTKGMKLKMRKRC